MKPYISLALVLAAASGMAFGAATAYTPPVGYISIPLPGTAGASPTRLQVASQGLLPSDTLQYAGVVDSFGSDAGGTYLLDSKGTWAAGDYINSLAAPTFRSHLVEITSGPLIGTLTWVKSTQANKIYTFDDISAALAGASYRVLKAFKVSTLLGTVPTSTVLAGAANIGTADNFLLFDPDLKSYKTFWYKSGGIGGTGWRCDDLTITTPGEAAIHPNDSGMVFVRKQSSDGVLVISGSVKSGVNGVFIRGGAGTVLNIVSVLQPVGQLTPATSGLYTTNPATGVLGAANIGTADNILVFDAAANKYTIFWYKSGGIGGTGWRCDNAAITDPTNYVFPPESAILIQRKNGTNFTWNIPAVVIAP